MAVDQRRCPREKMSWFFLRAHVRESDCEMIQRWDFRSESWLKAPLHVLSWCLDNPPPPQKKISRLFDIGAYAKIELGFHCVSGKRAEGCRSNLESGAEAISQAGPVDWTAVSHKRGPDKPVSPDSINLPLSRRSGQLHIKEMSHTVRKRPPAPPVCVVWPKPATNTHMQSKPSYKWDKLPVYIQGHYYET